jgi:hypothetical protein
MSRLNVYTFLEMDTLPHQNASIDVNDKVKCCIRVSLYQYIHIRSVSLNCLYVSRYTTQCLYKVTL